MEALGLPSRFGVHWGVCEMRGEEVSGLAVWAAARVMSSAGPGEILVSEAMRELLKESVPALEDRGTHVLKAGAGFELAATNELGDPVLATAAISDGMMFVRSQRFLWGIGRKTLD